MVLSANRSADSELGVIDVGSSAFSADSFDQIEIVKAGADAVYSSFVESASRDDGGRGLGRRSVGSAAFSLDEDVSRGAVTRKGVHVVSGIWGADIADASDQIVSSCTDTSLALVYLISSANWVRLDIGVADAVSHVVAEDTDALAEDVVVDLINRAVDGDGLRASGRWHVGGIGNISGSGGISTNGCGGRGCAAGSEDMREGLSVEVVVTVVGGSGLRE